MSLDDVRSPAILLEVHGVIRLCLFLRVAASACSAWANHSLNDAKI
jgi:hypothetical protein